MTMQLPPLPEQEKRDLPIGDTVYVIRAYSEESMQAYATLACKERDALIVELSKDAERYRWLRRQTWYESHLALVHDPKRAVKPGHDCPSLFRLDEAIDAALAKVPK